MRKNWWNKDRLGSMLFLLAFLGLSWWYNYPGTFAEPPQSVHTWRQTNSLSITQMYFQYNVPFFHPEIHNQISAQGLSGNSAGEFPIIYYLTAQYWKLAGKSEASFRLFQLAILFAGLLLLFRLLLGITGNVAGSGFVSMLVFTSPMVIFYDPNFLPDVPSLAFIFVAWYFLYRFTVSRSYVSLVFSALFFTLALTLKITSLLSFLAIGGWVILEMVILKPKHRVFSFSWIHVLPFLLGSLLVISWYLYVERYNAVHGGRFSYHGIWPVWNMSSEQFYRITEALDKIWFKEFFWPPLQYATVGIWLFLLFKLRRLPPFFGYLLVAMPFGLVGILMLWFQVLEGHDYYMITQIQVLVVIWGVFFYLLKQLKIRYYVIQMLVMLAIFLVLAINGRERHLDRYVGWMNEGYIHNMEALTEIEPSFEQWGIGPNDKVISIPDNSINASLYYMNHKGYTNFASDFSNKEEYQRRIQQGASYLVVNDSALLHSYPLQSFTDYFVGAYRNVWVYDLRPYLLK